MYETAPVIGWLLLQSAPSAAGNPLIPVVLMIVVFYLVLFLPMRRRQKKHDELLANLKAGDRVVTSSGMIGTVKSLTDKTVTLKLKPSDTLVEFTRAAVSGLAEKDAAE
mgnify:CR=1 FL=1